MFSGKNILVTGAMGLSGMAAVRLYGKLGATVFLSDRKTGPLPDDVLRDSIVDLRPEDGPEILDSNRIDFIVTAPGVPLFSPIFRRAKERAIPVYGENDFAFHILQKFGFAVTSIAITGTDGKSTTTALLEYAITEASDKKGIACGNFGKPVSSLIESGKIDESTVAVVECSSFQLEATRYFHPAVSMILNVATDHMDRYPDMNSYLGAKLKILTNQTGNDLLLSTREIIPEAELFEKEIMKSSHVRKMAVASITEDDLRTPLLYNGEVFMDPQTLGLPGLHNLSNVKYAISALEDLERRGLLVIDRARLQSALQSFSGLPHRMEVVTSYKNVLFINDSKATTVQAVSSALTSLPGKRVFLLLGGRDKGSDFSVLKDLNPRASFIPFGEAAEKIAGELGMDGNRLSLRDAFLLAADRAIESEGDSVVILSPGCSSYDAYTSFEKRGDDFKGIVSAWVSEKF